MSRNVRMDTASKIVASCASSRARFPRLLRDCSDGLSQAHPWEIPWRMPARLRRRLRPARRAGDSPSTRQLPAVATRRQAWRGFARAGQAASGWARMASERCVGAAVLATGSVGKLRGSSSDRLQGQRAPAAVRLPALRAPAPRLW
jgi:hypothetical protein